MGGGRVRFRLLAVVTLVLGATMFAPASAASASVTLSVTRSGYFDIALPANVSINPYQSRVSTRGTYGGWLLLKRGAAYDFQAPASGAIWLDAFTSSSAERTWPSITLPGARRLAAGTYRVYVVGDAPTTVSIPVEGMTRPIRLSGGRPSYAAGGSEAMASLVVAGPAGAIRGDTVQYASQAPTAALVVSAVTVVMRPGAVVMSMDACASGAEEECSGFGGTGWMASPIIPGSFTLGVVYGPGELPKGELKAEQSATLAGSAEHAAGGFVAIELVGR